ncbi:MAG: DNA-binding response regulator [Ignavibacteria bacterium]|nr:MAG: DNA-binding response regulator [Ignavibacteria bacterium]
MSKRILVIDDDRKLTVLLKEYLGRFGYEVQVALKPSDAFALLRQEQPDLIILDLMLPEMDGFEVCRQIRADYSIPIIMLTARGDVADRIVGLELGADDYLPKPFEPRELVARIQSVLRRLDGPQQSRRRSASGIVVDFDRQSVEVDGKDADLTTAEFEIFSLLFTNPGKVMTRERLLDRLRGIDWDAFSRSVDVLISRLRQKLGDDPKSPRYIKTVWGSGYMFIGEDAEAASEAT